MDEPISLNLETTPAERRRLHWLVAGTGASVMVLLFALWPYQSWSFGVRSSVLTGWARVVRIGAGGEWEFCLFVPFIVGFLVYREKERLRALPLRGHWSGAAVMALGTALYFLGYKVDTGYLGYAALQVMLAGLILLLAGREWWRALFFCWLFLFFAWPLFPLDNLLAARLKMPTAQVAAVLLRWCGVDTLRVGSVIESAADVMSGLAQGARFKLEVSDSCSGIRSLYTLLMVAALYGHLALRRSMPRLIIFCSAIPLAVIGNVVRLLMLAFGSLWFGEKFAIGTQNGDHLEESTYHLLCGFAVFGVALGGIFALASFLEGRHWKSARLFDVGKKSDPNVPTADLPFARVMPRACAALVLGGVGIVLCLLTPAKMTFAEPGLRAELPAAVDGYQSLQQGMTAKERQNFDDSVQLDRRIYVSPLGREIMVTVVLAGELKKTLHPPYVCLPDAGWIISDISEMPLELANGRTLEVTLMRVFRDVEDASGRRARIKGLNIYWYEGTKLVNTPSYFMTDVISYRDAIFLNLNHRWGQVSFFLRLIETENSRESAIAELMALQELKKFVAEAAPKFLIAPR